jgi:hypothetical protein
MTAEFDDGIHINEIALAVKHAVEAHFDGDAFANEDLCNVLLMVLARFLVEDTPASISVAADLAAQDLKRLVERMSALGRIPSRQSMPDDLSPLDKMRFAVRAAIVDTSPRGNGGTIAAVNLDMALSTMAWMIAAIGVQAKLVDDRTAANAFVREIDYAIEQNLKALRASGDAEPFAPGLDVFRPDRRH